MLQIQRGKNCRCFPTAHTPGKQATAAVVSHSLGSKGSGAAHQAPAPSTGLRAREDRALC